MNLKKIFLAFLSQILLISPALSTMTPEEEFVEASAPLIFYLEQTAEQKKTEISFKEENLSLLWQKTANALTQSPQLRDEINSFCDAYDDYQSGSLKSSSDLLDNLRDKAIDIFMSSSTKRKDPLLEDNSALSNEIIKKFKPYMIPVNHPMRKQMDQIFANRPTLNLQTYRAAGFIDVGGKRPRSFVQISRHPSLPGYLVKAYLDTETRNKKDKESWTWLVNRCKGARQIKEVIRKKKFRYFRVADKWIYPLPAHPAPPETKEYQQHLAVLLVTDMNLVSKEENLTAWFHFLSENQLDELYTILSYGKGSSYRPDNITYSRNGYFAFIDTEYPDRKPNFDYVRTYLRPEMKRYWDKIVKNGGN